MTRRNLKDYEVSLSYPLRTEQEQEGVYVDIETAIVIGERIIDVTAYITSTYPGIFITSQLGHYKHAKRETVYAYDVGIEREEKSKITIETLTEITKIFMDITDTTPKIHNIPKEIEKDIKKQKN